MNHGCVCWRQRRQGRAAAGVVADIAKLSVDWRTPRPPAWQGRPAGLRCRPAADQERLDPVRPRRPGHRPGGAGPPPRRPSRAVATWMSTWGPAAAMVVSSMCPDKGCWRSGSTTGHRARAIRCCTPSWSSLIVSRAGRPRPVPASAGRGHHVPGQLSAQRELMRTRVEWPAAGSHGTASLRGCPRSRSVPDSSVVR
jgi:hypothetical protein